MLSGDLVAVWEVALSDGVYRIEFAHGTTTGKRVVYVNGQVRAGSPDQSLTAERLDRGVLVLNQRTPITYILTFLTWS